MKLTPLPHLCDDFVSCLQSLGGGFLKHASLREKLGIQDATCVAQCEPTCQEWFRELVILVYRYLLLALIHQRQLRDLDEATKTLFQLVQRYATNLSNAQLCSSDSLWQAQRALRTTPFISPDASHIHTAPDSTKCAVSSLLNGDILQWQHGGPFTILNEDLLSGFSVLNRTVRAFEEVMENPIEEQGLLQQLGGLLERMLELCPLVDLGHSLGITDNKFVLQFDKGTHRKRTGAYYTSQPLVDRLIELTLAPVLRQRLADSVTRSDKEQALLSLRVCDPACGTGNFLFGAVRYLTEQLIQIRTESMDAVAAVSRCQYRDAMQHVVRNCIYGIDRNPLAADLTRILLWLACRGPWQLGDMESRIVCDDAFAYAHSPQAPTRTANEPRQGMAQVLVSSGFDVILGNPPYGATLDDPQRRQLASTYPHLSSAGNSAAYFLGLCAKIARPHGRIGLVMPKSLTYSCSWARPRQWLVPRLHAAVDIGKAWEDVRLEQVLVVYSGEHRTDTQGFQVSQWRSVPPQRHLAMEQETVERLDAIPTGLSHDDLELLRRITIASPHRLGEFCRTYRGTNLLGYIDPGGDMALIGGKDIGTLKPPTATRAISRNSIEPDRVRIASPGQVLFQNIVAHLTRPSEHLRLIGTVADQEYACLDTLNLIEVSDPAVSSLAILGLLLCDVVNWFVYACVYNRAIRTMHFDGYFLKKILVPPAEQVQTLEPIVVELLKAPSSQSQWRRLNQQATAIFGLTPEWAGYLAERHKPRWL